MSPSATSVTPPRAIQQTAKLTVAAVDNKLSRPATMPNGGLLQPLDASKLIFTRNTSPKAVPAMDDPIRKIVSFCTDHMITAVWHSTTGWSSPELKPYGPFSIWPTANVLHYATECFEGMKVYRGYDGKLRLFRPDCNSRRMLMSAVRIALPAFDPDELEKLILKLMEVDGPKFLPRNQPGQFMYLRPTMIGTQAELGVQMPKEATLFVIASYMPELSSPPGGMRLLASQNDAVRAWPGGFGFAKVGANYGPTLMAQQEARARGFDQILWLLGEDAMVTEAGASNFFVLWRTREGKLQLVTAPLENKIILDGVTRRSVLQLAKERLNDGKLLEAVEVVERTYTMADIVEAVQEDRIVEAFACGTAFFVCPVSHIHFRGKDLDIPMCRGNSGEYTALMKSWLVNIMYGKEQHPWGVVVDEKDDFA